MTPKYAIFMIFILQGLLIARSDSVFIESPHSVNAIHGTRVVFNCTILGDILRYQVNDTILITNIPGFIIEPATYNDGLLSSKLTASALVEYNNTNVTCLGGVFGQPAEYTEPALLQVQGSLSSVVDLSYSFIDSSTVTISWSPPFTLLGTDITGYNISATGNGTTTNYFTSSSYYQLSLTDISDSPCEVITISVSGYNGLDGESTTLTGIYLPSSVTNEGTTLDVLPLSLSQVNSGVQLSSISINVSSICYGQYPTHINLTIQYSNNGSLVTTIDNIPLLLSTNDTNILSTTNDSIILLPLDSTYTAIITYSSKLGGMFNISTIISISTHAVESVSSSNNISAGSVIVFECVFTPYLHANGCIITINNGSSSTLQYTSSGIRTVNNTASVVFCGIIAGVYTVSVYDDDQQSVPALQYTVTLVQIQPDNDTSITQEQCTSSTTHQDITMMTTASAGTNTTNHLNLDSTVNHPVQKSTTIYKSNTSYLAISLLTVTPTLNSSTIVPEVPAVINQGGVPVSLIVGSMIAGLIVLAIIGILVFLSLLVCIRYVKRKNQQYGLEPVESVYVTDPVELKQITNPTLPSDFDDRDGATSLTRILDDYDNASVSTSGQYPTEDQLHDDFIVGNSDSSVTTSRKASNSAESKLLLNNTENTNSEKQVVYDDIVNTKKQSPSSGKLIYDDVRIVSGSKTNHAGSSVQHADSRTTVTYAELSGSTVGHQQPRPPPEQQKVIYWELQSQSSTKDNSSDPPQIPPKIPPKKRGISQLTHL